LTIFVLIVGVASFFVGFAIPRWFAVPAVSALVPLYMLGLSQGWWGTGVGDGWQYGLAIGIAVAAIGAAAGVLARRSKQRPV
jgi:hypothetical protein